MDRVEAIQKLVPIFRRYGYEGATLARISAATNLGRASLYHHFPKGKKEMAKAVLEYVGAWFHNQILEPLQQETDPAKALQIMGDRLNQFYNHGQDACLIALFTVGEPDELFHEEIQQRLKALISAISTLLQKADLPADIAHKRAEDAVMGIQGALVLARGLNDNAPFERVIQQLGEKLLAPVGG